ncbi:cAMP-dependent protein kinase pathway protein [Coccidioides posadasii str. Silveira]|uniref:cAMP-dependent protein kinase pathway protein n=2 Tax=Coccidioides posadasii TaxID=199306 RepID=E9DHP4_COCPS|nr:cAMP-dependent protein kinase pathway protein [Coccidioides posadasii str. Silveira]KMM69450.1 OefA [Coccidioides posadasii RMSCC 3488]
MNQMNMQGMHPAGGPVGGIPMMNTGSSAPRSDPNANPNVSPDHTMVVQLNTYIYDYFLKRGYIDCARALVKDSNVPMNTAAPSKSGHRDGEVNGVDPNAMVTDSNDDAKPKIPDDLPRPNLNGDMQQTSFLFDWFNLFWDVFWAQRKKGKSTDAMQYLQHTQNILRLRDHQQNQLYRHSQMMPSQFNMRMGNGMMRTNMQKSLMQANAPNMTPQQLAQLQQNKAQLMHHQMQREHSDIEMNGHRPQSPSSVENAPSPSKRPRLDGTQVNGQQMTPNGRAQSQGMPGQPNQQTNNLLMQHGINPRNLTPAQIHSLQAQNPSVQAKSLQGMPNGLMNPGVMPNQGEVMPLHDGQGMLPMQDYYAPNGQMAQMRPGMQTPGGQAGGGNHALQDYQMQLMLLEQQNKRRLMMARQEQDNMARADGQPGMVQPNLAPGTSPQGSRTGASPNPNEQMKRGTPKLPQTGLPGSPNVGDNMGQSRGSPASMNFAGGQMPPEMGGAAFFSMKPEGVVGPNGMRPPSSNPAFSGPQMTQPMDAMARPQPPGTANRMPAGNWQQTPQGQPMIPQPQQPGQGPPGGTPQERNAMPPPQAPAAGAGGRAQPPSPQPGTIAPPTPQQANKPAPKTKKDTKDNARKVMKRPTKAKGPANTGNTAATPSSEAEPPPTPTPSTPITPVHPNSFNKPGPNANAPQPTSAPAPQAIGQQPPPQPAQQAPQAQPPQPQQQQSQPQQQPQQDPNLPFGDMNLPDTNNYNLDFTTLDNPDILENFDFDTFLNTDDPTTFAFEPGLSYPADGVEAGAGETM